MGVSCCTSTRGSPDTFWGPFACFSRIFICWVAPMVCRCNKAPLDAAELPALQRSMQADYVGKRLAHLWEKERRLTKPSLIRALLCLIWRPFASGWIVGCANGLLSAVIRPLILRAVVQSIAARAVNDAPSDEATLFGWPGLVWDLIGIAAIAVVIAFEGLTQVHSSKLIHEDAGVIMASSLSALLLDATLVGNHQLAPLEATLYATKRRCGDKSNSSSSSSSSDGGEEELAAEEESGKDKYEAAAALTPSALYAADVTRLYAAFFPLSFLPLAFTAIAGGTIVLMFTIGVLPALAGLGTLALTLGLNVSLSKCTQLFEGKALEWSDKRLAVLKSILDGIRAVKMFCWEEDYLAHMTSLRNAECAQIRNMRLLQATAVASGRASPILASMAAIVVYALVSDGLDAADVFAAIAVFQALRMGLITLPIAVTALFNVVLSTGRIQRYLILPRNPERATFAVSAAEVEDGKEEDEEELLRFSNVALSWSHAEDAQADAEAEAAAAASRSNDMNSNGKEVRVASTVMELANRPVSISTTTLRDLTFSVRRGEVVAVVGSVGSGKSTLISAAVSAIAPCATLPEEDETAGANPSESKGKKGTVEIAAAVGPIGYAPQSAKIYSGTIHDNVLLGRAFDQKLFSEAITRASFDADIKTLSEGLDTAIGERGCTLSGGQQQRLAIARAIYADPELLIFDDVLSAVDTEVGERLFADAVLAAASDGAAVLIAMNQLDFLPRVTRVIFLHNGRATIGAFEELLAQGGEFNRMIAAHKHSQGEGEACSGGAEKVGVLEEEEVLGEAEPSGEEGVDEADDVSHFPESSAPTQEDASAATPPAAPNAAVAAAPSDLESAPSSKEEKEKAEAVKDGSVSTATWIHYIRSMGFFPFFFTLIVCFFAYVCMVFADLVLTFWISGSKPNSFGLTFGDVSTVTYAVVYVVAVAGFAFLLASSSYLYCLLGERASKSLHYDALAHLLRAPVRWFDENSSGRVYSRFANDLLVVDQWISFFFDNATQFIFNLAAFIITLMLLSPTVLALFPFALLLFGISVELVDRANRNAKRLSNNAAAPIITNIAESFRGRDVTKCLGVGEWLQDRQFAYAGDWARFEYASGCLVSFGMLASYGVSFFLSISSSAFVILMQRSTDASLKLSPAMAALAIGYSFLMPYYLCMMAGIAMRLRMFMCSLERLLTVQELPQEAKAFSAEHDSKPGVWPQGGEIEFTNVSMKYQSHLPLTLKGVSFKINAGESVGIVGRTGAGKSSLLATLFRLVDADCVTGHITIDGVDIHAVGLTTLRSRVAIIPQEPTINAGTVRSNLDPFGGVSDEAIQIVLDRVGLAREFAEMAVDFGGTNLSAGERQLVCLARTLVLKEADEARFRIVCMDESTANLDFESDESMRGLIKRTLKGRTTLIIAHRLNTIVDCDRVLVMDNGRVAEYDRPAQLLRDSGSMFYGMAEHLGGSAVAQLLAKAVAAEETKK